MTAQVAGAFFATVLLSPFLALFAASSFNVRDFGAVGDGVHDDTLAIQKAADALYPDGKNQGGRDLITLTRKELKRGGKCDGPAGEVFLPRGTYRVTGPVKFFWCANVRGEKGTVIRNDTRDQDTFYFHLGARVRIDSLSFEGGFIQVRQWTRNISDATLTVTGCSFSNASGTALVSDSWRLFDGKAMNQYDGSMVGCSPYVISKLSDGRVRLERRAAETLRGWPNSTAIYVSDCRFKDNVCAFNLESDGVFIRDCEISANASATNAAARVETTAHISRTKFKVVRNPSAPAQCALRCGRTTAITECEFSSAGPVVAVESCPRCCRGNIASQVSLKDIVCDTGDAPVLRFVEGSFPNMLIIDGLAVRDRNLRGKKVFSFEREPSVGEVASWPVENSKGVKWGHPAIDLRKCVGISIAGVSAEFDAALPPSLEQFLRKVPAGLRRHEAVRLSPMPGYAVEFADAAIGADVWKKDAVDDADRLEALFAKAAKAGGARVVLPPKWIRLGRSVSISGNVHVVARGRAMITAKDGGPAFRVAEGSSVVFENIGIYLGKNAFACEGAFGSLRLSYCELAMQQEESISAACTGRSAWRIELDGGTACTPFLYKGNAAPFLIDGYWHTVGPETPLGDPHKKSFAAVVNLPGGVFDAQDVIGVPRYFENEEIGPENKAETGDYCWFDNRGTLRVYQFRFGGERGGLTPVYHREGASTYVEGGFSAHLRNWRLRDRKADAIATCKDPDLKFVDVVGFNFFDEPPMPMLYMDKDGSSPIYGKTFNCYPYPLPPRR